MGSKHEKNQTKTGVKDIEFCPKQDKIKNGTTAFSVQTAGKLEANSTESNFYKHNRITRITF